MVVDGFAALLESLSIKGARFHSIFQQLWGFLGNRVNFASSLQICDILSEYAFARRAVLESVFHR